MDNAAKASRSKKVRYGAAVAVCAILVLAFAASGLGARFFSQGSNGSSLATTTSSAASTSSSSSSLTGLSSSSSTTVQSSTVATSTSSSSSSNQGSSGDWTTYHGSNTRDGYDLSLPEVASPSVAWHTAVDAAVYAEPLSFNGSVYVATENDTVYSMSISNGAIEWSDHVGVPANSTVAPFACGGGRPTIAPTVGVTGTPVIDPKSGTLYVVAMANSTGYKLFAINSSSGTVLWSTPLAPTGFTYYAEEQRGALALANGFIYIPFGGFSWDCGAPYGWVVAFSANGNGTQYDYKVPATGGEADIWAPEGISVDSSGYVYAVTADSGATSPPFDYSEAVLKLSPDLSVVGYFGDSNYTYLNANDLDLADTGATLLPGNLVFSIGKEGTGYLLNSSSLGGVGGQLFGAPVCSGGAWGSTAYASGTVYVPCGSGLYALGIQQGINPTFVQSWNATGFFAGPPIVAAGAVWTMDIYNGTLFALDPATGHTVASVSVLPVNSLAHFSTPSVGGGMILFAGNDSVYALNPS